MRSAPSFDKQFAAFLDDDGTIGFIDALSGKIIQRFFFSTPLKGDFRHGRRLFEHAGFEASVSLKVLRVLYIVYNVNNRMSYCARYWSMRSVMVVTVIPSTPSRYWSMRAVMSSTVITFTRG